ncbi:MAG: ABC transporter ATP-binding protein [Ruminococcaceae bacterium]|nr:ABC transporter ATP-binding protein [Oscillospiraceae bacterium]
MLQVSNLTKKYGSLCAVNNISFKVGEGEILGFLGPNGAGKTTTMNMITGYLAMTEGRVSVAGYDVLEQPMEAKRRIGYLPEQPPLYTDMTVDEYLCFVSELKKSILPMDEHITEICKLTRLEEVRGRLIANLSKGYRQRVGIAQALIGNPPLLILDEPTIGLDPNQIVETRALIRKLGEQHTVVLSTHILSEVQAVCDRVVVLNKGDIVADSTVGELSDTLTGGTRLIVTVERGAADNAKRIINAVGGVRRVTIADADEQAAERELAVETERGTDLRRVLWEQLAKANVPVLGLRVSELSLEDIFLTLTR